MYLCLDLKIYLLLNVLRITNNGYISDRRKSAKRKCASHAAPSLVPRRPHAYPGTPTRTLAPLRKPRHPHAYPGAPTHTPAPPRIPRHPHAYSGAPHVCKMPSLRHYIAVAVAKRGAAGDTQSNHILSRYSLIIISKSFNKINIYSCVSARRRLRAATPALRHCGTAALRHCSVLRGRRGRSSLGHLKLHSCLNVTIDISCTLNNLYFNYLKINKLLLKHRATERHL